MVETQEAVVYHVISDGQAEDSSVVVDEGCRVDSKGRHADIQHVVVLGWQVKGRWWERRLLMFPDVVKFPLRKKTQKTMLQIFLNNKMISLDSCKNVVLHNSLPSSSDLLRTLKQSVTIPWNIQSLHTCPPWLRLHRDRSSLICSSVKQLID